MVNEDDYSSYKEDTRMLKKMICIVVIACALFCNVSYAENTGIIIIGEDEVSYGTTEDMIIGESVSIDGLADVTIKSIEFKKVMNDGELLRCFISANISVLNKKTEKLDLRVEIDTAQIFAVYNDDYQFSGYFTIYGDFEKSSGYHPWFSKNVGYSSSWSADDIKEMESIAEKNMILDPLYEKDNYWLQIDMPPFVFDNEGTLTISFMIADTIFTYSGEIEHTVLQ